MGNTASVGDKPLRRRKITKQDQAILDLKLQRDNINRYQKKIQFVLDREYEIAKECLARKDKKRALLALRKRKYQEQLLEKTDKQLETLEELVRSVEFALVEKDIVFGLQQGTTVLKELNKEMSIEAVEKLMDESSEAIAYQREVDELLSTRITHEEEEGIQEELAALELAALGDQASNLPVIEPKSKQGNVETEEETVETVEQREVEPVPILLAS